MGLAGVYEMDFRLTGIVITVLKHQSSHELRRRGNMLDDQEVVRQSHDIRTTARDRVMAS